MPHAIIKGVEYLEALEGRYGRYGRWRFLDRNNEIYAEVTEVYDVKPLIKKEIVHPYIPVEFLGV